MFGMSAIVDQPRGCVKYFCVAFGGYLYIVASLRWRDSEHPAGLADDRA